MRKDKIMKTTWISFLLIALATVAVSAAEPTQAQEKKGPLADRPSAPGPHLAKIEALSSNQWVNLGKPKPDPKYGPAQGRAWSRKMAYAPDLRGAFIYGEGVHGGASTRGGKRFYNDDLFFYDINAHAWVCCHPGTPLDNPGLSYDKALGCERDKHGNIIPVAVSVHAYWTPDYDTDRKMFTMMPSPASLFWHRALKAHRPYLGKDGNKDPRWGGYGSPWYWDPRTGKWEFRRVKGPAPRCNVDNVYFYSRKLKKGVNLFRGVWLYDHEKNSWQQVNRNGGGNGAYCYDHKREWIYAVHAQRKDPKRTNRLTIYDIANNKWITPKTKGDAGGGMESGRAFFTYDSVNDVAALHIHDKHHIYDPETETWTALPKTLAAKLNWGASSGFYDPELNAHFYFNAGDSNVNPGNMWVWRYGVGNAGVKALEK